MVNSEASGNHRKLHPIEDLETPEALQLCEALLGSVQRPARHVCAVGRKRHPCVESCLRLVLLQRWYSRATPAIPSLSRRCMWSHVLYAL